MFLFITGFFIIQISLFCVCLALRKGRVLYVGNNNKMISQLSVGSQSHLVARMFCGCGISFSIQKESIQFLRSNSYSIGDDVTRFSFCAQKCHPMGQRFIIGSTHKSSQIPSGNLFNTILLLPPI